MKRILIAVAAAAGVAGLAGECRANGNAFTPPYLTPAPTPGGPAVYGVNPVLRKLMWWKKDDCASCGKHAVVAPPHGVGPGNQMPGTLVFPVNPYIRSPRDFFMTEPNR